MTFRIGQKVVCIDDQSTGKYIPSGYLAPLSGNLNGLKRGVVYTIRDLSIEIGVPVCRLEEIVRDYEPLLDTEAFYAQARFRAVVEKKTDISIFTAMLKEDRIPVVVGSPVLTHEKGQS